MSKELEFLLSELKTSGCVGIKVSFEDEGAQLGEMAMLRYLTAKLGLELVVKIGGAEAKDDIRRAVHLPCDIVVAPMIESPFALQKFVRAVRAFPDPPRIAFNLETIQAYRNLSDIMGECGAMDAIIFGRVDFISSIGHDRSSVDTKCITEYVHRTFEAIRQTYPSIECCVGGAISAESRPVIEYLRDCHILDRFETRYVIFDAKRCDTNDFASLIQKATEFELVWLRFLRKRYLLSADKDLKRIEMIEQRNASARI